MSLYLLDVSNMIYRAFYTLSPDKFKRESDELAVNAVYGVMTMILKLVTDNKKQENTFVACMDSSTCNRKRQEINPKYKENRSKCPDKLRHQYKWIREALDSLSIARVEVEEYEADDIIASIAKQENKKYEEVIIVSPDKDMCQLVEENIVVYNPSKKEKITRKEIKDKYDVYPEQFPLYQAIMGDKIDNIIGISGIGPKRCAEIINYCNGNIENMEGHKKQHLLEDNRETIMKNLKQTTLNKDLKLNCSFKTYDIKILRNGVFCKFLDKMEIKSNTLRKYT